MKKIFTVILLLLMMNIFYFPAFSKNGECSEKEDKHPIDIKVEKCIVEECHYATACTAGCINASDKDWEKEIDKYISKLKRIMNSQEQEVLMNSQNKWEAYRKAQEKLDEKTIGTIMGSMFLIVMASNRVTLLENRAKELEILYRYFSDK